MVMCAKGRVGCPYVSEHWHEANGQAHDMPPDVNGVTGEAQYGGKILACVSCSKPQRVAGGVERVWCVDCSRVGQGRRWDYVNNRPR